MNEFENNNSPVPVQAEPVVPTPARVLGYICMACGSASLCTLFLGIAFSLAGLITGGISRSKNYGRLTKQARIGKILSIIGIPVSILFLVLYILLFVYIVQDASGYVNDYYFFTRLLLSAL